MGMKILHADIETAPNTAHVWGLFKQNISINQLVNTGRVMCWAAKWHKVPGVMFEAEHDMDGERKTEACHGAMIEIIHGLLDEADAVCSYNGKRFDVPTLNREFMKYGLKPPSPYHHIDLLEVAKRQFRFVSNKMDHLAKELGIRGKVRHQGHDLWTQCMAGDPKAWKMMRRYNIQDVRMLEQLYERMRPWIVAHPNHAMYTDDTRPACTNCGSHKLQSRGTRTTRTQQYRKFQCQGCGTWVRDRFTSLPLEKRRNTLIQA